MKTRIYRELNVVTGWDVGYHDSDSYEYPTYSTFYEDVETGLLVIDREKFEKWAGA